MKDRTFEAIKAAERHFQQASNHHGDAPHAITTTAAGLQVLTGVISDLLEEMRDLRKEVKMLSKK